jgi:hypothetical protein
MIPSEKSLMEFDAFVESLCEPRISIDIDIEAKISNLPIYLAIEINAATLAKQEITEGSHHINLVYDAKNGLDCCLKISMSGKSITDTVIEHGQIIKDTWVEIKKLKINNFLLSQDYDFFRDFFEYFNHDDGIEESVKLGFWKNSSLILNFQTPFDIWYQEKTTKNVHLHDNLKYRENNSTLMAAKEKFIESIKLLND